MPTFEAKWAEKNETNAAGILAHACAKTFEAFPDGARQIVMDALSVAAEGGMAGIAKPMKGLGSV